eukprot:1185790-Prorocentrum_minimum.AAC.1
MICGVSGFEDRGRGMRRETRTSATSERRRQRDEGVWRGSGGGLGGVQRGSRDGNSATKLTRNSARASDEGIYRSSLDA